MALLFHHRHRGIGGVLALGGARQQPFPQDRFRGAAGHDLQGHPQAPGQIGHLLALLVAQTTGIENHRQPAGERRFHQGGQGLAVEDGAGPWAVEIPLQLPGWPDAPKPEQAFAFHIGAKHHGPQLLAQPGRQGALAAAGEPVHQHQPPGAGHRPALGQGQVALQISQALLPFLATEAPLAQPQGIHLGPYQRPVGAVPGPTPQALRVVLGFDPAVEQQRAQVGAAAHRQVHHQKGQLTDRIDPAQGVAEFQRVEHFDARRAQQHVAQVQIAVAFADLALGPPPFKPGAKRRSLLLHPAAQPGQLRAGTIPAGACTALQGGEVVAHRLNHGFTSAPGRGGRCALCMAVELGQGFGERPDGLR